MKEIKLGELTPGTKFAEHPEDNPNMTVMEFTSGYARDIEKGIGERRIPCVDSHGFHVWMFLPEYPVWVED